MTPVKAIQDPDEGDGIEEVEGLLLRLELDPAAGRHHGGQRIWSQNDAPKGPFSHASTNKPVTWKVWSVSLTTVT